MHDLAAGVGEVGFVEVEDFGIDLGGDHGFGPDDEVGLRGLGGGELGEVDVLLEVFFAFGGVFLEGLREVFLDDGDAGAGGAGGLVEADEAIGGGEVVGGGGGGGVGEELGAEALAAFEGEAEEVDDEAVGEADEEGEGPDAEEVGGLREERCGGEGIAEHEPGNPPSRKVERAYSTAVQARGSARVAGIRKEMARRWKDQAKRGRKRAR